MALPSASFVGNYWDLIQSATVICWCPPSKGILIFCYDMITIHTALPLLLFVPIRKAPTKATRVLEMQQDHWGRTFLRSPPPLPWSWFVHPEQLSFGLERKPNGSFLPNEKSIPGSPIYIEAILGKRIKLPSIPAMMLPHVRHARDNHRCFGYTVYVILSHGLVQDISLCVSLSLGWGLWDSVSQITNGSLTITDMISVSLLIHAVSVSQDCTIVEWLKRF